MSLPEPGALVPSIFRKLDDVDPGVVVVACVLITPSSAFVSSVHTLFGSLAAASLPSK